jgi:hypothetical protein
VKRLISLCAGAQIKKAALLVRQDSLNILSNVAAGDFRNCVSPVPLLDIQQQEMKQPSAYPLDGHADGCLQNVLCFV